ncbi:hypothetical protein GUJ93_ZPchr0013g33975 [Zizania palustris]|uniref:Uncharacterized protein n=1 Tax=Zizania palustris TaxID=103762 RepID=A0A8J5WS80_ZIZPA|nr:hypothetical protein GUJ93_ZPchr0013g33975 [Zizania palustris]
MLTDQDAEGIKVVIFEKTNSTATIHVTGENAAKPKASSSTKSIRLAINSRFDRVLLACIIPTDDPDSL